MTPATHPFHVRPAPTRQTAAGPIGRILAFDRPFRRRLALAAALGVGAAAAAIGLTATSAWLLSRAAQQPPVLYLMVAITGVRAFGILRGTLRYVERLASHDAAFRILAELRRRAYVRLERLAPAGLDAYRSGDLLARLVGDVDSLADLWLRVLLPCSVAAIAGAGAALLVGILVPAAGAVLALSLVAVGLGAPILVARLTRAAEHDLAPARGALAAGASDLLRGSTELLAAGASAAPLTDLARVDARLAAAEARTALGGGLATFLVSVSASAATWLALVLGVQAVRDGTLDGVALAVVVLTPIAAHDVAAAVVPAAAHLPGLDAAAARVVDMLDRPDPVVEPVTPAEPPGTGAGVYGIRIRALTARYGAPDDGAREGFAAGYASADLGAPRGRSPDGGSLRRALGPIDLEVAPAERALITGPSGSGKSTLAAVLVRFLEPASGGVAIVDQRGEAVPLTDLTSDVTRSIIGLAPQDPHVFDTSIAENLLLARPAAEPDELRAALRTVHLLDWVDSLPAGVDTLVGEHGARLSGGQRQRLALARILLSSHPVVVLDEPTEHLDETMARNLMADVLAAIDDRTVFVLTHRPELMPADGWAARVELARSDG